MISDVNRVPCESGVFWLLGSRNENESWCFRGKYDPDQAEYWGAILTPMSNRIIWYDQSSIRHSGFLFISQKGAVNHVLWLARPLARKYISRPPSDQNLRTRANMSHNAQGYQSNIIWCRERSNFLITSPMQLEQSHYIQTHKCEVFSIRSDINMPTRTPRATLTCVAQYNPTGIPSTLIDHGLMQSRLITFQSCTSRATM